MGDTNCYYVKRDLEALGQHYTNHVSAMTIEGLHSKSDIAAELAFRDREIERLQARLRDCELHYTIGGEDRLPRLLDIVNSDYCKIGKNIDWSNDDVVWLVQKVQSIQNKDN